jgi:hypothetical protein
MNLTINGRQVTVDDSFRDLPREDQEATVAHIADSMEPAPASGALAGAKQGLAQVAHGVAETGKMLGIGNGFDSRDPNYVPADPKQVSGWPQVIAENTPAMGAAIMAGGAAKGAASLAKLPGKYGKLAGLVGAGLAGWLMTAGDTAKERAVQRTGDANAEPNTQDKLIGSGTAAAAQIPAAIAPARLIPGATSMGLPTLANAAMKAGITAASGAAGNAAADAITQAGTTVGTDKGLTVDPSRVGDAAITGGLVSAAHGSLPLAGDVARAASLREHMLPENIEASKAYASRLANTGNELGSAKNDRTAQERVKSDLGNELSASAKEVRKQLPNLSVDADNALTAAEQGKPLSKADVELITKETAAAPDGPNAAHLARTLRMAQLNQEHGVYSGSGWAGGVSGHLDAPAKFLLNPLRVAGGLGATALGLHVFGLSNPKLFGSVAGAYALSRGLDNLTGMRSPAATFAQHFADRNSQLRLPTQGPAAPSAPQGPASPWGPRPAPTTSVPPAGPQAPPMGTAQGPWGPKPLAQNAVPQVAPPAAPSPQVPLTPGTLPWKSPQVTELPNISPIALNNLQQTLKQGLPAEPQAQAAAKPAPTVDPLDLPTSITKKAKNLMGGMAAVQEIRQKTQANDAVAGLASPLVEDAPLDVTQNPMVGKRASQLVSAANALRKYTGADVAEREQAQADAQAAREEKAAAKAAERQKSATERAQALAERAKVKAEAAAAKAELAKAKAEKQAANDKVKAAAAKVKVPKVTQEVTQAAEHSAAFEPLPDDMLYPDGITPKDYAEREAALYGGRGHKYKLQAEASARRRNGIAAEITSAHPQYTHAVSGLLRQLHKIGPNPAQIARAVEHYKAFVPDDVAKAMDAFK